jgi:hypothetical protein
LASLDGPFSLTLSGSGFGSLKLEPPQSMQFLDLPTDPVTRRFPIGCEIAEVINLKCFGLQLAVGV